MRKPIPKTPVKVTNNALQQKWLFVLSLSKKSFVSCVFIVFFMKSVSILAIDDHEITSLGYKYILEYAEFSDFKVNVDIAKNFDTGKQKIKLSKSTTPYSIILLDIQLSSPGDTDLRTGINLASYAREEVPKSNIVFMSSYSDNYRINNAFKTVNPDGYMVKSEIDELTLKAMVETVISETPYYTASAISAIRKRMASDIVIDSQDLKILHHLSQGVSTKDIAPLITSTNSTVENRKRHLKELFNVKNGNDLALINEAKNRGFL